MRSEAVISKNLEAEDDRTIYLERNGGKKRERKRLRRERTEDRD